MITTSRTNLKKWSFLRSLIMMVAALSLAIMPTAAHAATGVGQYPNTSPYYCVGGVGLSKGVQFGTGPILGYIKIKRSSQCSTAWAHTAVADNRWVLHESVWHPNGASAVAVTTWYNVWIDSVMIASNAGSEVCMGAQAYVRGGPWIGWYFGGCYTP
jgi:hypothetical protein